MFEAKVLVKQEEADPVGRCIGCVFRNPDLSGACLIPDWLKLVPLVWKRNSIEGITIISYCYDKRTEKAYRFVLAPVEEER